MTTNCPVCARPLSSGLKDWHQRCTACSYERANFSPEINLSDAHDNINEIDRETGLRALRLANFKILLEAIQRNNPTGRRLLDVGCAHGWFLDTLVKDFDVLGVEPDETVCAATASRGLPVRLGYFPDALSPGEKFDVIVFNDVFEHIPDPKSVLAACHERLNDDGVLVLNLPNSGGLFYRVSKFLRRLGHGIFFDRLWQKGLPSPHLHYFNPGNLGRLLNENRFSTLETGHLPTLSLSGLYARISCSGNLGSISKFVVYACVALAIPLVKWLPSDIIYVISKKS